MMCFGMDHFSIISPSSLSDCFFYCVCGLFISFIHVKLLYKFVLVSAIQQLESIIVTCICPPS